MDTHASPIMRIAQVAPLFESVPPRLYGGTERVVSFLTEALVRAGHSVTLFASADSVTSARLVPCCERALRLDCCEHEQEVVHQRQLHQVFARCDEFDILHFHTDRLHFRPARRHGVPHLTTLHGRLDLPDLVPLMREFQGSPLVSISEAQRLPLPWATWIATVQHGLPRDLFHYHAGPGRYLAFLGRISPEKRCDRAIEIAIRAGLPLRIAAKVDAVDKDYYEQVIRPLMRHPLVEYVGEINEREKDAFLGNAMALLFPIDWPEPFGLVMIEAMACATPVLAFDRGSVREVVDDGVTGQVVHSVDEALRALPQILQLDRRLCRQRFEQRFTSDRMAQDYLRAYLAAIEPREDEPVMEASNG
jgi:glycosyltransferase involved in cell wall biosynthesis